MHTETNRRVALVLRLGTRQQWAKGGVKPQLSSWSRVRRVAVKITPSNALNLPNVPKNLALHSGTENASAMRYETETHWRWLPFCD